MRDVTTSVAAFLILAILTTGIYVGVQKYQEAQALPVTSPLPGLDAVEGVINTLLGGGEAPTAPPPLVESRPSPTDTPTPVPPRTSERAPLVPPPTPVPLPTPTPLPSPAAALGLPFSLRGSVRHDDACGSPAILGTVWTEDGRPLPGITLRLEDEQGNSVTQISASQAGQRGQYRFDIDETPQRYTLWIVDEGGNALSPRVEILHRLPNSGYETFPCHYIDWVRSK